MLFAIGVIAVPPGVIDHAGLGTAGRVGVGVIAAAELDAELERHTARYTTRRPERPLGTCDAQAADSLGPTAEELGTHPATS